MTLEFTTPINERFDFSPNDNFSLAPASDLDRKLDRILKAHPAIDDFLKDPDEKYWLYVDGDRFVSITGLGALFVDKRRGEKIQSRSGSYIKFARILQLWGNSEDGAGFGPAPLYGPFGARDKYISEEGVKKFLVYFVDRKKTKKMGPPLSFELTREENYPKPPEVIEKYEELRHKISVQGGSVVLHSPHVPINKEDGFVVSDFSDLYTMLTQKKEELDLLISGSRAKELIGAAESVNVSGKFMSLYQRFPTIRKLWSGLFRDSYWSPDGGGGSFTWLENFTGIFCHKDSGKPLEEFEEGLLFENFILPLWAKAKNGKNLAIELPKRDSKFISKSNFLEAAYLLWLFSEDESFGLNFGISEKETKIKKIK